MKAKTLIELLTLSTNIYMITKDEKFMNNLKEMSEKGKEKVSAFADEWMEDDEEKLLEKLTRKAHEAKEELENKISEVAEKVYAKMNIAHTHQVDALEAELNSVRRELALAEARILTLETNKK